MIPVPLWQTLKNLISLDSEIITLKKNNVDLAKQLKTLKQELENFLLVSNQLHANQLLAKKNVHAQELSLTTLTQTIRKKQQLRDEAISTKELTALNHELEVLEKKRPLEDDLLLSLWSELEKATSAYEQEMLKNTAMLDPLKKQITELEDRIALNTTTTNTIAGSREQVAAQVAPEWLSKYESMRSRVENPIVPAQNGVCSSCFYSVAAQELIRLKKSALLNCKNCYRLLYYEPQEEPLAQQGNK